MNCSKNSFVKHSSKTPCHNGRNCKRYPHCNFYHSPENIPECSSGRMCKYFPHCVFHHSPNNTPKCPFMEKGCTNLNCQFWHPKGYVHACIHGENCKKRDTCPYTHPPKRALTPSREAPLPQVPSDIHIIGDKEQSSEFKWICSKSFEPSNSSTPSDENLGNDYFIIEEDNVEYLMDPNGDKVGLHTCDDHIISMDHCSIVVENGTKYIVDDEKRKVGVYTSDHHFIDMHPIWIDSSDPMLQNEEEQRKKTDKIISDEMDRFEWNKMTDEFMDEDEDEDEWDSDPESTN